MSSGYSWEGIRQISATLLGACHVPERLCGDVYLGRYIKCSTFAFYLYCCNTEMNHTANSTVGHVQSVLLNSSSKSLLGQ